MRQGHYIAKLLEMIAYYRLADRHPDEIDHIVLMAENNMLSDAIAKAQLQRIRPWIEDQKLCWNGLPPAPTPDKLGEFDVLLGELIERPGTRAGIRFLDKPRHILISGATGSAKSSLLRRLIIEIDKIHIKTGKPISILVLDPKGDFVDIPERLGRRRWRHYSVHDGFRIGLNPPVGFKNPTTWSQLQNCFGEGENLSTSMCGGLISAAHIDFSPSGGVFNEKSTPTARPSASPPGGG